MAEGVLFDVAARIIEKIGNLAVQELGLLSGVKDEIVRLGERVSTIKAVLLDAEKKEQTNQVKEWLKRLNDAIYDADDLLDDISTEALQQEVMMGQNKKSNKVCIYFSKSNPHAYALKMAHEVKVMMDRLDAIGRDRLLFHFEERPEETHVRNRARETHSFVCAETVIGRENDKKAIIGILLDSNVKENVSILPIVGIGGLGKTTVAQLVFNDEEFKKNFDQNFWVCVSDDFEVRVIVEKIMECAKNEKPKKLEMNTLVKDLKKEIDGKKYLLVLDDVWNDNREKWLSLKELLMSGAKGSRILVTTREEKVAKIVQTMQQQYILKGLNVDDAWILFKQMAFENGQEPKNPRIKPIGMEIIEKCRGVPLAIRSIGSLLYFKNSESDWLSIKNSDLLKEDDILQTLKLSYDHLPSYLKQCFAYCCLFPKDYKIHKTTLIKMWMAQGFIRSSSPNQCLEDIGHDYFMDLLWRSFFQEVEEDGKDNILQFKMHDLMHNLAKSVASSDSATFYSKEENIHEKTRHVSFDRMFLSSSKIPVSLYKARRMRTFYLPNESQISHKLGKSTCNAIVSSFKFVRLLDLNKTGIKTIPSSIGKLRHLRYLDLSNTCIKMLPNSITRLHNLQTLRLSGCCLIKELPKDINKLVNLMYLEIDKCWDLTHMPRGLGQLTKLRTLSRFVLSQNSCLNFRHHGGLKELNGLNKLRGKLLIKGLRHGKEAASESKDANMKEKQCLHGLALQWIKENDVDESNVVYDEESLVALLPNGPLSNLQELYLIGYGEVKFPSAISSLSNLVNLTLDECNKCQHLPPLDHFHSLKTLSLKLMKDLEYISERENNGEFSDYSFLPSLEQLTIEDCPNLKGWWQRQRDSVEEFHNHSLPSFPHLSNLRISECPKLISLPLFPYLERLELWLGKCSLKPLEQTLRMEVINTATPENLTSASSSSTLAASSFIPLSKLKSMTIWYMEETLPKELMCNLISLQDLEIYNCCGPLPLSRHLTALQNLSVLGSQEVDLTNDGDEMEWHGLQSLRYLEFQFLPNLATLPVGIQHLTSLERLRIEGCPSLLAIPEWFCNLTSLQTLRIWGCPILSKRCEREAGEDWSKIEHIPDISIDRL